MAPLYGRLTGERCRKTVTRRGFESVESRLETWEGSVRTVLDRELGTRRLIADLELEPPRWVNPSGHQEGV
jgi:hypothetical protein